MQKQPQTGSDNWTILKLINWTTDYFKSYNIESPRAAVEILLAHVLNLKRIDLYLKYDQPLLKIELAEFKKLIKRRIKKEPVAYIVGNKEFWSKNIEVTKDVLIPRPETEILVETALEVLNECSQNKTDTVKILELGTGSGAIVIALASENPQYFYFATDISQKAIKIARQNVNNNSLKEKVCFFCGKWFDPVRLNFEFDIIISNPPYVQSTEINELMPEVSLYEPKIALDGGKDGLDCFRHIIAHACTYLKPEASLILEIGYNQKEQVKKIISNSGRYHNVVFKKDYAGKNRIVSMKRL